MVVDRLEDGIATTWTPALVVLHLVTALRAPPPNPAHVAASVVFGGNVGRLVMARSRHPSKRGSSATACAHF